MLTVPELLDLIVRLEDDPARRNVLDGHSYGLFRAAVDEGLVSDDQIDGFAAVIGHAYHQGAIGFRRVHGGAIIPQPDQHWTDHAFQSRNGYYSTVTGQQIAALYRERRARGQSSTPPAVENVDAPRDLFISHASEEKETVVRPLAAALTACGWSVWIDELELTLGDSLSGRIDAALAQSHFGVVVLSEAFFAKPWPQRELAGLAAREIEGTKVILPVWHGVDRAYIVQRSPTLADRLGVSTDCGIEEVADQISKAVEQTGLQPQPDRRVAPAPAPWTGILGGDTEIFIGAHVIDPTTGRHGQVEQVLSPTSAVVRLEDGSRVHVSPRPAGPPAPQS